MSILGDARLVIAQEPICDACVGRVFAERSFGLTNAQRGNALRIAIAIEDDIAFEPAISEECWVCEGQTTRFDEWTTVAVEALERIEFDTYQVGTRVPPLLVENDRLLRENTGMDPESGELLKSEMNREIGKRIGDRTGAVADFDRPDVLALVTIDHDDVDVQINPAFVYGRYRKLKRNIPQTEWPCSDCGGSGKQLADGGGEEPCDGCDGSGFRYDRSVEGLTTPPIVEAMDGVEGVFHGAGREDVDARMLGTGRPFVIEVKHPRRRTPDLSVLEPAVNDYARDDVEVTGLRLATHKMVERVKELPASKTYRMTVEFEEPIGDEELVAALETLENMPIDQDTPRRVSHRRADKTRVRQVYSADGEIIDPHLATLEVHGEGGLYIKELISGDDGRTTPSLSGLLGVSCTVTALDVIAVEGEDEPFDDPAFLLD